MVGKKRFALVGVGLISGLTAIMAPGASADTVPAPSLTRCFTGEYCVFKDSHYNDSVFPFTWNDSNWSNNSNGEGFMNDEDSSAYNRGTSTGAIWQDSGWGGPRIVCLSANTGASHFATNDEGTSNWRGDCNPH